jgi:hypothetical protein
MRFLATSSTRLDDLLEPVDLKQPPGDLQILSFADSDLSALAAAWPSASQRPVFGWKTGTFSGPSGPKRINWAP